MKRNISDDDLLNFLDGAGTAEERKNLSEAINENTTAKKRLKELESVHFFLMNQKGLEEPSKNFTDKVMEGLRTMPSPGFFSPGKGLILLAGLVVASGLALAFASTGAFDQLHTIFNFSSMPIKTDAIKLPQSVPFDVKVLVKVFVMINLAIAFVLLDRTILRPIFRRRSENFGV